MDDGVEHEVLDRVTTPRGELVLRRAGEHLEVISNGVFLMDTRDGTSERVLVRAALDAHPSPRRLLIGGLGVGFSLREAVSHPTLEHIDVVEIEPVLVAWHATHLAHLTASSLADPRVTVAVTDVTAYLGGHAGAYDVVCLDVDNGPEWTVTEGNVALYSAAGLGTVAAALGPGGVLAVWSASAAPTYERLLREVLDEVEVLEVPSAAARGGPDLIYLARQRSAAR